MPLNKIKHLSICLAVVTVALGYNRVAKSIDQNATPAESGADFIEDAKLLMRIVACAGDTPLPAFINVKVVEAHCKLLQPAIDNYRKVYVEGAKDFIAGLRPANLPSIVVYPFSGGDLVSALTAYPEASEITTISLELTGDPSRVSKLNRFKLEHSLMVVRQQLLALIEIENFSRSTRLSHLQQGDIPALLSFFLVGLAVHDYEPLSLRFFQLEPSGEVRYLSTEEIAAIKRNATSRKGSWLSPDFSEAFANVELTFRKRAVPESPVVVHRHIAANIGDNALKKGSMLLAHLNSKGRVAVIIKAASYLLWQNDFSIIRDYLLTHADFMISESSGIPPSFAITAGYVQETYGDFFRAYLPTASEEISKEFEKLWKSQPHRELPFRFGYPDTRGRNHLLITRLGPKPAETPSCHPANLEGVDLLRGKSEKCEQ
jgi:hypothetical protein